MNIQAIVEQLEAERDRLTQAINALSSSQGTVARRGRPVGSKNSVSAASGGNEKRRRGRGPMTAAQKKRISEMMKKRWAERKKAQAK